MDRHNILSGAMVCRLMRKHGVTIAGLATKFQLTKKRVREVRAKGGLWLSCERVGFHDLRDLAGQAPC